LWAGSCPAPAQSSFVWTPISSDSVVVGGYPYVREGAGQSWSLQGDETSASHAFRFEVREGDHWPEDQSSGENKERSELDGYKTRWAGKTPVWVAYSFLVEPGDPYRSDWTAISQMHGSEVRPFFVFFKNEEFAVIVERLGPSGAVQTKVYSGKLGRGHWHSAVYKLTQSSSQDGALKVWLDGAEIVDYHGPIGSDTNKAYWKFGIYRGYGPIATPFAIEFANMEISRNVLSDRIRSPLPVR
jgi:hypothetical protein